MSMKPVPIDSTGPRFIDPNSPLEKQQTVFLDLIKNPPENSRVISICPALAKWLLDEHGSGNRTKKPVRIKRYAHSMELDNWYVNGETIIVGQSGLILDGQNRLAACVRSGKTFKTHVVFNIPDQYFAAINSGKARTGVDTFGTVGIPHPEIVAPCARWLMIFDLPRAEGEMPDRSMTVSNEELFEFYKSKCNKDGIELAVLRATQAVKGVPRGQLAAHLYLFERKHAPTAKRFAGDLEKGVRVGRKLIDKITALKKQNMGRLHEAQVSALVIQAWNIYRKGGTLTGRDLNWNENKEYPAIA